MTIYKPTPPECKAIREYAAKHDGYRPGQIKLEVGERYNIDDGNRPTHINLFLVTDDPEWADTDLVTTLDWTTFTDGVTLTEDGRAVCDFYVYERGRPGDGHGDLITNVQAHIVTEDNRPRLFMITGTGTPEEFYYDD